MKIKVLLTVLFLSYVPLCLAGNKAEYPNEKIAKFVPLSDTVAPRGYGRPGKSVRFIFFSFSSMQ